mgnify:CR=1 FL=1
MHRLQSTWLVAATLLVAIPGSGHAASPISDNVKVQIQALQDEKAKRTPVQKKISSHLLNAYKLRHGQTVAPGVPVFRTGVKLDGAGMTLVDIKATVTPAVLEHVRHHGGIILFSSKRFNAIRARIPLDAVETIAAHADIDFVRPAGRAITNKLNTSEGDITHNAVTARSTYNVDGSGVSACVLSNGVDSLATVQGTGDLPAVTVLAGQAGSGDEGTAMLEIVYDLAPGASLSFATAQGGEAAFAQNILDLGAADCNVIVDDATYFAESVFQNGPIAQAIDTVTTGGALYFSAAGNAGNLNDGTAGVWEGDFSDGGAVTSPIPFTGRVHDFGGSTTYNTVTSTSGCCPATLHWSDAVGASGNDYDLYVLDSTGTTVIGAGDNIQDGNDDPYEQTSNLPPTGSRLVIVKYSGAARYLHLNTLRGELAIATTGQTAGHSAASNAIGVAAVSTDGVSTAYDGTESVETFSSDGPRRIFYESNGTAITAGNFLASGGKLLNKPDITAADGVTIAAPGFSDFHGTSAAAPHAAAIAALLFEADPTRSADHVKEAMLATALDIEAAGQDRDSGAGIVMAGLALQGLLTNIVVRGDTAIALLLAKNGNAYTPPAANTQNYSDVDIGVAGVFGDGDYAADWIEQLLSDSITTGCDASNYCPRDVLTKDQLAMLVWKTKFGATPPPNAIAAVYADVPAAHAYADWIKGLKDNGYTTGCDASNYCPTEAVTLGGLAKILNSAF